MKIVIVGPGRAGGSLTLGAIDGGHEVVGVVARSSTFADKHQLPVVPWDTPVPYADLMLIAVRDDIIGTTADRLAPHSSQVKAAVHLSGFSSVGLLEPLAGVGVAVGSFHPLQTFPDAETGARSLAGAWVAVTAADPLAGILEEFAADLGMRPFGLADEVKPWYHAGAAAASNFVVTALGLASDLLEAAGVPLAAARPLAEQILANSFDLGPDQALTGPVARGDWSTVHGQLRAAAEAGVRIGERFRLLTEATVLQSGQSLPIPPPS